MNTKPNKELKELLRINNKVEKENSILTKYEGLLEIPYQSR